MTANTTTSTRQWLPERSRNMTARIAAARPRCSGSRRVTATPATLGYPVDW